METYLTIFCDIDEKNKKLNGAELVLQDNKFSIWDEGFWFNYRTHCVIPSFNFKNAEDEKVKVAEVIRFINQVEKTAWSVPLVRVETNDAGGANKLVEWVESHGKFPAVLHHTHDVPEFDTRTKEKVEKSYFHWRRQHPTGRVDCLSARLLHARFMFQRRPIVFGFWDWVRKTLFL